MVKISYTFRAQAVKMASLVLLEVSTSTTVMLLHVLHSFHWSSPLISPYFDGHDNIHHFEMYNNGVIPSPQKVMVKCQNGPLRSSIQPLAMQPE